MPQVLLNSVLCCVGQYNAGVHHRQDLSVTAYAIYSPCVSESFLAQHEGHMSYFYSHRVLSWIQEIQQHQVITKADHTSLYRAERALASLHKYVLKGELSSESSLKSDVRSHCVVPEASPSTEGSCHKKSSHDYGQLQEWYCGMVTFFIPVF